MKRLMFAAAGVAAAATAFGVLPCRFLHEMTGEYVTPHHSFRGSDAEKPLKVLFLLDRTGGRDAVEAVQRFNIEPTYFLMVTGDRIAVENMYESAWTGTTIYEKTRELDEKLDAKYDLYVFGDKTLSSVNEEHRYRILKAVRDDGAGRIEFANTRRRQSTRTGWARGASSGCAAVRRGRTITIRSFPRSRLTTCGRPSTRTRSPSQARRCATPPGATTCRRSRCARASGTASTKRCPTPRAPARTSATPSARTARSSWSASRRRRPSAAWRWTPPRS